MFIQGLKQKLTQSGFVQQGDGPEHTGIDVITAINANAKNDNISFTAGDGGFLAVDDATELSQGVSGMLLNGNQTVIGDVHAGANGTAITIDDGSAVVDIHADGGLTLNGAALPIVASGIYTPTVASRENLVADPVMNDAQYMRVGSVVTVSGIFTARSNAQDDPSGFEINLPIASVFEASAQLAGSGGMAPPTKTTALSAAGVLGNNTAKIKWIATDNSPQKYVYHFTYKIVVAHV